MEHPPWGSQLQNNRREQDTERESTWKKIRDPATLKELLNAQTSFLFASLAIQVFAKEQKLKRISVNMFTSGRQLWKWHSLRLCDHKLKSYICS